MIYRKKSEFDIGNFNNIEHAVKTIYEELRKSPCQNFIKTVFTEGI